MPVVSVRCSHCSRSYSVDGLPVGRKARCKHCGHSFAVTPSGGRAAPVPGSGESASSHTSSSSSSSGIHVPERIGRFLIKQQLGAGACGSVYRAFDPTLDRDVALKVPHREFQQDPEAVERFLHEAKAAAKVQHAHIVPIFETGADGDSSYIASAFIRGGSLAEAIDEGRFEPRRAARIVASLADALHTAHQQGIVHRDVKPANVLLDDEDRPHLTDFGLARLTVSSAKLTHERTIVGTPAYLAPEQARGQSDKTDAASDQYSLGVTLYELLTGQVPFAGPVEVVIFHTLQTPPPALRDEHPDIPAELEAICLKALSKQPEDRYASCRDLAKDLGNWLAGRMISREIIAKSATTSLDVSGPAPSSGPATLSPSSLPSTVVDQNVQGDPRSIASIEPTGRGSFQFTPRHWTIAAAVGAAAVSVLTSAIFVATWPSKARIEREDGLAPISQAPNAEASTTPLASPAETKEVFAAADPTEPAPPVTTATGAGSATANTTPPAAAPKPEIRADPIASVADRAGEQVRTSTPNERPPSRSLAYHEQMAEVQRALAAKDIATASRVLAACPAELRGWEWRYCQGLCELNAKNDAATGSSPGNGAMAFATPQVRTINEVEGPLTNVAFSPEGTRVVTTSGRRKGPVTIRDAGSGALLNQTAACDVATWALAYSPDSKFIATGSLDSVVRIWDATTLKPLISRTLHASRTAHNTIVNGNPAPMRAVHGIESVAFSPDSHSTASAGDDGTVRIWDFADELETRADYSAELRGSTASSGRGKLRKDQSEVKNVRPPKSMVRPLGRETQEVMRDVVWDREGRWVASGGTSKIIFWDFNTRKESSTIDFLAQCLAVSPDGRLIAAANIDHDQGIQVWEVATRKTVVTLMGKKAIAFIDFSPDGKRLATVGRWNVQIWDAATGHHLLELGEPKDDDPNDQVFSMGVRFSPDGRRIASVRGDLLRIWSIADAPSSTAATPTAVATKATPEPAGPTIITTRMGAIKLTRIPSGTFLMGAPGGDSGASPIERPQHSVRISKPFYLGVYEITQAQYRAVMGHNPSWFSSRGGGKELVSGASTDQHPVENFSWFDAVKFCDTLSERERLKPFYRIVGQEVTVPSWDGTGYRLPTEAEWEYACRAGTQTRWSYGDESEISNWPDYAWQAANSGRERWDNDGYYKSVERNWQKYREELSRRGCRTHPVGGKRPNGYGLYDMHGNVAEWCWDWYGKDYYQQGNQTDPTGPEAGNGRISRGGSWVFGPWVARSSCRPGDGGSGPNCEVGFRLARTCP